MAFQSLISITQWILPSLCRPPTLLSYFFQFSVAHSAQSCSEMKFIISMTLFCGFDVTHNSFDWLHDGSLFLESLTQCSLFDIQLAKGEGKNRSVGLFEVNAITRACLSLALPVGCRAMRNSLRIQADVKDRKSHGDNGKTFLKAFSLAWEYLRGNWKSFSMQKRMLHRARVL